MSTYYLQFVLKSDATFGRGDGVAGDVDAEVMHDEWGLPYLGGRAIKGLLVNECADILAALPDGESKKPWTAAAGRLFGRPGSLSADQAAWSLGDAQLPEDVRTTVMRETLDTIRRRWEERPAEEKKRWEEASADEKKREKRAFILRQKALLRAETLETLTTTRHQTAMEASGVPKEHSLRVQRVVLRETPFEARLESGSAEETDLGLLAACMKAFRRAGTVKNRGRGLLEAVLLDEQRRPAGESAYKKFKTAFGAGEPA